MLSVLISVYHKENPIFLNRALTSIWDDQIMKPNEIVLVKDGALTRELDSVVDNWKEKIGDALKIVVLNKNYGLGQALNEGLKHCSNELVARMDSDDISAPSRFSRQYFYLISHPEVSIVGSYLEEFNTVCGDLKRLRKVPLESKQIINFSKRRNPLNHPTVMFRKSDIIEAGSYKRMELFEDYYLWVRLIQAGRIISNLDEILLYFRVGNNMIGRRHGFKYIKLEFLFYFKLYKMKFISYPSFLTTVVPRVPVRLLPLKVLNLFYKTFLR